VVEGDPDTKLSDARELAWLGKGRGWKPLGGRWTLSLSTPQRA